MDVCTYLTNRGPVYYFRRAVPVELRPYLDGRVEWMISLRTKDRATAKRAIPQFTIETDGQIGRAASARAAALTKPIVPVKRSFAAQDHYELEAEAWEAEQSAAAEFKREQHEGAISFLLERMKGSTAEMPPEVRAMKYIHDDAEFDRSVLMEQLAHARAEIKALSGETTLRQRHAGSAEPDQSKSNVPMLETFDSYAEAQGVSVATTAEWRASIAKLIEFLGHDDAARLTTRDLMRWRDDLLSEVSGKGRTRAPGTVRGNYIRPVKTMLAWAVQEQKLAVNVAADVRVRVPKAAKLRDRAFTPTEAAAILRATLAPETGNMSAENRLARRWVPWLCAYTGARVNEVGQLRLEDVRQLDGIWSITITPEAGTVKTKEARTVPLHSHLVEQGFLEAVQGRGAGPLFYAPKRQRIAVTGSRHFKKVGERLATWVRGSVGITDPNVQPNHAWRHLFKTMATAADIQEKISDAITGHAPTTVGRKYGSVPLRAMSDAIELIPRFDVDSEA